MSARCECRVRVVKWCLLSSIPELPRVAFRCSAKSPEVGLGPRFSLHSLSCQSRVVCLIFCNGDGDGIDLRMDNLDLLIRRFNAPDRERNLTIRELERRKAVEAAGASSPDDSSKSFEAR